MQYECPGRNVTFQMSEQRLGSDMLCRSIKDTWRVSASTHFFLILAINRIDLTTHKIPALLYLQWLIGYKQLNVTFLAYHRNAQA